MASASRIPAAASASQSHQINQRTAEFASDVVAGLSQPGQKELPSKYLYDEVGSALFDVICLLPEYGLSRAGMRLLARHSAEIVDRLPGHVIVAELGSGSGQKTRWLLEALARRQRVNYYPIDISSSALFRCQQELGHMDMVSIVGFERAYLDGLNEVASRRRDGERLLVLFLGSTIGNFDRPAGDQFLREVRAILRKDDALLLATDLQKPFPLVKLAYDDPAGVTAAFNMNLLARINREIGGDFDLSRFEHVVRYDEAEQRVEMHLRSKNWQRVVIRDARFSCYLREGETIWTESSHKYNSGEVITWANAPVIIVRGSGSMLSGRSRKIFFLPFSNREKSNMAKAIWKGVRDKPYAYLCYSFPLDDQKAKKPAAKKKTVARKPATSRIVKRATGKVTAGRNGDPSRVRAILQKLDEAYPTAICALKHENAFQLLIATILSAQCTDERVNIVTASLFPKYPNPKAFAFADAKELEQDIRPTGFFRNKTKSIMGASKKIVDEFHGEVPRTMEQLLTLPGVARKTANVVLGTAFGIASGVVVDTHVTRLSERLDLTRNTDPKKIELDLMQVIPQGRWILFSHQLIWHGRRVCRARKPRCLECNLEPLCYSKDKTN